MKYLFWVIIVETFVVSALMSYSVLQMHRIQRRLDSIEQKLDILNEQMAARERRLEILEPTQ
jgi:tRNA(Phe) wybutosine-synthesizing methylase Tyw3